MLSSLRDSTLSVKRITGTPQRKSYGAVEQFPVYWEEDSQRIIGSDGNEIDSIAYGDIGSYAALKIGDVITSVTDRDGIELLGREESIKQVGTYSRFSRQEIFI